MALDSYTNLKTALASFLDVNAADFSSVADDIVTVAEKRIFSEVNHRVMHLSMSATISSGVVAIPSDFLDHVAPYVITTTDSTRTYDLAPISVKEMYACFPFRAASSRPQTIASEGANFIFGPYPESGTTYVLKGPYKAKLAALSTSENALFAAHPELYLYASLLETEVAIGRDVRMPVWEAKYREALKRVNKEDTATGQARAHY